MKPSYLVIDYNNVRFTDVAKIKTYVKERYGLDTVLIHPQPAPVDYEVSDVVIDLNPKAGDFVERALAEIRRLGLDIRGGFPFSDRAIVGGSKLLEALGVRHDSTELGSAALSKISYREAERRVEPLLRRNSVFIPAMEAILELAQLKAFFARHEGGIVLKPACEGNNRGVTLVRTEAELDQAWLDVLPYLKDGIIAEQMIPFRDEFSFDGIGGLNWVTKKLSHEGTFPVERGQQVPSFLEPALEESIKTTGRLVNELSGSTVGAFHNEIKLSLSRRLTAVVEPNRRPAGMNIWDLAEKVYGLNFYHLLVDATLGGALPEALPRPRGVAAVRMLPAPVDGRWKPELSAAALFARVLEVYREQGDAPDVEFFNFLCHKKSSDRVGTLAKQNGDFVAQVCAYSQSSETELQAELDRFESAWTLVARTEIAPEAAESGVALAGRSAR